MVKHQKITTEKRKICKSDGKASKITTEKRKICKSDGKASKNYPREEKNS